MSNIFKACFGNRFDFVYKRDFLAFNDGVVAEKCDAMREEIQTLMSETPKTPLLLRQMLAFTQSLQVYCHLANDYPTCILKTTVDGTCRFPFVATAIGHNLFLNFTWKISTSVSGDSVFFCQKNDMGACLNHCGDLLDQNDKVEICVSLVRSESGETIFSLSDCSSIFDAKRYEQIPTDLCRQALHKTMRHM